MIYNVDKVLKFVWMRRINELSSDLIKYIFKSSRLLRTFMYTIHRTQQMNSIKSKKISNDQELIPSDPISCPQNQKGNN